MTSDLLLALSVPALVGVSGLYALGEAWWRRRHPGPRPVPYLPGRGPVAGHEQVAVAEAIVAEAYARYGALYDTPAPGGDGERGALAGPARGGGAAG
ncbi:hypothetical protein ACF068_11940 [Streptomyces sp. NPDC016309]|uniref:hypothetical protein n=1 Tax=Streptomyces sp. NPDC016309 TaxID=3364965 RepID=UPI0036FEE9A8